MDIQNIKTSIINALIRIKNFFKETLKLPKAKLYIFLSIPLTIMFIILTFPYEVILQKKMHNLKGGIIRNISAGRMEFSLLDEIYFDYLALSLANGMDINTLDLSIDITVNPFTLFVRKKMKGDIKAKNIKIVKGDISVEGSLTIKFDISFDPKQMIIQDGFFNVNLQNTLVKGVNIKGFDIPPITFTSIVMDTSLKENVMVLNKFVLAGPDLNGKILGDIALNISRGFPAVNLKIEIDKNSRILDDYKPLLGGMLDKLDKISIGLKGAIISPQIEFNMPGLPSSSLPNTSDPNVPVKVQIPGQQNPLPNFPSRIR